MTQAVAKMLTNEAILELILQQRPMRRLAEMPEVVAPARFLASDVALHITGAALVVDGCLAA